MKQEKNIRTPATWIAGGAGATAAGMAAAAIGGPVGLAAVAGFMWAFTKKTQSVEEEMDEVHHESAQKSAEFWRKQGSRPGESEFSYSCTRRVSQDLGLPTKMEYRFSLDRKERKELSRKQARQKKDQYKISLLPD